MGFINNQILPSEALKDLPFGITDFVGCDANVPSSGIVRVVIDQFPVFAHNLTGRPLAVVGRGLAGKQIVHHVFSFFPTAVEFNGP